jgi:hypothetical protein
MTLQSYITWRIVLTLNSGCNKDIIQEHEYIHRNSMYYKFEALPFTLKYINNVYRVHMGFF